MKNLIFSLFVLNFLTGTLCHSMDDSTSNFLGTMAGTPTRIKCSIHNKMTYARLYQGVLGTDDVRKEVAKAGETKCGWGEGYKFIGEDYSFTPLSKIKHYGTKFSVRPSRMPGGGFFLTLQKFNEEERFINCFGYALGTFGENLEHLAQKNMSEIQNSVFESIDTAIGSWFDCITDEPKDGDLVIYQTRQRETTPRGNIIDSGENTHAGIYRNSEPNWNSPLGGAVESK